MLSLLLFPLNTQAKVYKCTLDDVTEFSQTPCDDNNEPIEVKEGYSPDKSTSGKILTLILQNKISIGMSRNDVIKSWGKPDDINSNTGSYGSREQWVYRISGAENQYVYIKDGLVSGWGD